MDDLAWRDGGAENQDGGALSGRLKNYKGTRDGSLIANKGTGQVSDCIDPLGAKKDASRSGWGCVPL